MSLSLSLYIYIYVYTWKQRGGEQDRQRDRQNPYSWASKGCQGPRCLWSIWVETCLFACAVHAQFMRGGMAHRYSSQLALGTLKEHTKLNPDTGCKRKTRHIIYVYAEILCEVLSRKTYRCRYRYRSGIVCKLPFHTSLVQHLSFVTLL